MRQHTSISCVDSGTMFLLGHPSFSSLVQALLFQPMPSIFAYENVFQARLPVITIDIELRVNKWEYYRKLAWNLMHCPATKLTEEWINSPEFVWMMFVAFFFLVVFDFDMDVLFVLLLDKLLDRTQEIRQTWRKRKRNRTRKTKSTY